MAPVLGVLFGTGLFLIWWSAWEQPAVGQTTAAVQPARGPVACGRD